MPEMHYRLEWPDSSEMECYSPSLVIRDYLAVGQTYPLPEFLRRIRQATEVASERVRLKFGFPCTRAQAQLAIIEGAAQTYEQDACARVTVLAFDPDPRG